MRITITTHHGNTHEVEHFIVDGDEFGVYASDLQHALASCVYRYNVSAERAEDLTAELDADGRTEHGWSTITYNTEEWA